MSRAARLPPLEWALRARSGALDSPGRAPERLDAPGEIDPSLGALPRPFHDDCPAALRDAVAGQPAATLQHALALLFERAERQTGSLPWWWSCASPSPMALAALTRTFGLDDALHGFDPARLARLFVLLPIWRKRRGDLEFARELLERLEHVDDADWLADWRDGGAAAPVCVRISRRGAWTIGARSPRIAQGLLVRERQDESNALHLCWVDGATPPARALRLLPAWMEVELQLFPGESRE